MCTGWYFLENVGVCWGMMVFLGDSWCVLENTGQRMDVIGECWHLLSKSYVRDSSNLPCLPLNGI